MLPVQPSALQQCVIQMQLHQTLNVIAANHCWHESEGEALPGLNVHLSDQETCLIAAAQRRHRIWSKNTAFACH